MTRDLKKVADGFALGIPEADLEKAQTALDALETSFRPLAAGLPHETEPAVVFHCPVEEGL